VEEQVQYAAEKELLEASNQAKSDVLMLAGHELRTPLTGSIGATDLLLQTELTEKQRQYVDLQKESNTSLLFLVNNILDYSKLSAFDNAELREKIFLLRDTVAAALNPLKLQSNAKNCTIRAEYADDVPNKIFGEESRIRQLLANLLGNAVKFSNNCEILIKISVDSNFGSCMSIDRIPILFEVIDGGIGVLPEHREQLFEQPKQENVSTRRYDGMGLGLTISKSIVKSLGGKIGYRETSGGGSTFWFSVPLSEVSLTHKPASALTESESDSGIKPLPSNRTYRILVAEDNRINRIVVNEMLIAAGFEVVMAEDGRKAVEAWQSAKPSFDLILMDCQMPDVDGYEAAEWIRRIEKENNIQNPVPIVALTANAAPQDKERCLKIGMNAYHNKPIDAPDLLRTLQHWIR
jgi:CheY-like chemotaxis protein